MYPSLFLSNFTLTVELYTHFISLVCILHIKDIRTTDHEPGFELHV